jgi:glucokinase
VLHPEVFVIGGGMSHEGDVLIKPIKKYLNDYLNCVGLLPEIEVVSASLGNTAGLLGAAALIL